MLHLESPKDVDEIFKKVMTCDFRAITGLHKKGIQVTH